MDSTGFLNFLTSRDTIEDPEVERVITEENELVQIIEDGFLLPGFYTIDPKIKIRASR